MGKKELDLRIFRSDLERTACHAQWEGSIRRHRHTVEGRFDDGADARVVLDATETKEGHMAFTTTATLTSADSTLMHKQTLPSLPDSIDFVMNGTVYSVYTGIVEDSEVRGDYTVCLLFSEDLKDIALTMKMGKGHDGRLNGFGGRIRGNETPMENALRKISEDSNANVVGGLIWLGTVDLPDDCKEDTHSTSADEPACRLYYYAGTINNKGLRSNNGRDVVSFWAVDGLLELPVTDKRYMDGGDLQYFANLAVRKLAARKEKEGQQE